MNNNELPLVNIVGVQYTADSYSYTKVFSRLKAKIRFTSVDELIESLNQNQMRKLSVIQEEIEKL